MNSNENTIANELDGRERFVLAWIEKQVAIPYREISGETLDALIARGLAIIKASHRPRACWSVSCSELGLKVAKFGKDKANGEQATAGLSGSDQAGDLSGG